MFLPKAYSVARRKSPMEPLDVLSVCPMARPVARGQRLIAGVGMVSSTLQKDLMNDLKSVFDACWEEIWNRILRQRSGDSDLAATAGVCRRLFNRILRHVPFCCLCCLSVLCFAEERLLHRIHWECPSVAIQFVSKSSHCECKLNYAERCWWCSCRWRWWWWWWCPANAPLPLS